MRPLAIGDKVTVWRNTPKKSFHHMYNPGHKGTITSIVKEEQYKGNLQLNNDFFVLPEDVRPNNWHIDYPTDPNNKIFRRVIDYLNSIRSDGEYYGGIGSKKASYGEMNGIPKYEHKYSELFPDSVLLTLEEWDRFQYDSEVKDMVSAQTISRGDLITLRRELGGCSTCTNIIDQYLRELPITARDDHQVTISSDILRRAAKELNTAQKNTVSKYLTLPVEEVFSVGDLVHSKGSVYLLANGDGDTYLVAVNVNTGSIKNAKVLVSAPYVITAKDVQKLLGDDNAVKVPKGQTTI